MTPVFKNGDPMDANRVNGAFEDVFDAIYNTTKNTRIVIAVLVVLFVASVLLVTVQLCNQSMRIECLIVAQKDGRICK